MKENKLKQLYFSHDIFADKDEKIIKMFYYFKKNIDSFSLDFIKRNFFHASFGLFWEIVQYLHRNELKIDEIPMFADELRADEDFVRLIIEEFDLFRIDDDGYIISDRILKNLNKVCEKKQAAETRWLLSDFDKCYEDVFGKKPVLSSNEIEALKKYYAQIGDLREKLPDLIYTLKNLKFETNTKFVPSANWLLKDNNLLRLYNEEFGQLKHKTTQREIEEELKKQLEEQAERNKLSELELAARKIETREDAEKFISDYHKDKKISIHRNRACILPTFRILTDKFGITENELIELVKGK